MAALRSAGGARGAAQDHYVKEVIPMHKHDYTGAQVVRMRRQLRVERAERLWLYRLLAVSLIICAVLTGTLLAVAQTAGML